MKQYDMSIFNLLMAVLITIELLCMIANGILAFVSYKDIVFEVTVVGIFYGIITTMTLLERITYVGKRVETEQLFNRSFSGPFDIDINYSFLIGMCGVIPLLTTVSGLVLTTVN